MSKRTDKKSTDAKTPVTVNIFSNNDLSFDGKSVLCIIVVAIIVYTLVVSGIESETLSNLIRSVVEALLGS